MRNFANNFEELITRRGSYRVWVLLRDDGSAPLVSLWIDPAMRAFESQAGDQTLPSAPEQTVASEHGCEPVEETEDPWRRAA